MKPESRASCNKSSTPRDELAMTLFDAAFRQRCDYLHETARRHWGTRFLGRRIDRGCAGNEELIGHSDYASGDDFRYIDWPVCARHDELLTKQYRGSHDRASYLLLDASPNMTLGGSGKFNTARQLAAALGWMALSNFDRVGAAAFADRLTAELPLGRGVQHQIRLLKFFEDLQPDSQGVHLKAAAEAFVKKRPHRGVVVLLSDLFDPQGFEEAVDLLAIRGFEPFLLQIVDESDAQPGFSGKVRLRDAMGQQRLGADLKPFDLENYQHAFDDFRAACGKYCDRRQIGWTQTQAQTPFDQCLLGVIRAATARMNHL